jgi:hypothetical protein
MDNNLSIVEQDIPEEFAAGSELADFSISSVGFGSGEEFSAVLSVEKTKKKSNKRRQHLDCRRDLKRKKHDVNNIVDLCVEKDEDKYDETEDLFPEDLFSGCFSGVNACVESEFGDFGSS